MEEWQKSSELINKIFTKPIWINKLEGDIENLLIDEPEVARLATESNPELASQILKTFESVNSSNQDNLQHPLSQNYPIVTQESSLIRLPSNYETNDLDEKEIVDLMNEDPKDPGNKWKEIFNSKDGKEWVIYSKEIEGFDPLILKSYCMINEKYEHILKCMSDYEFRKKLGAKFEDLDIISEECIGNKTIRDIYFSFKIPLPFVDPRDFMLRAKRWDNYMEGTPNVLFRVKSIECDKYPVMPKKVRVETKIEGQFLIQWKENSCKVVQLMYSDWKFPKALVRAKAMEPAKKFIENIIKGCEMLKKEEQ